MRTELLLRDTLADLADQARTPEVTLTRVLGRLPERPPSRRRTVVLVLAAVLVLVLAVAVPSYLVNRTSEPVGRVPGNWNLNHRVELPPGWEVRSQTISPDVEETYVAAVGRGQGLPSCVVRVAGPGRGDPTAARDNRVPVTVNGHPAFWAGGSPIEEGGVTWEYQANAYALASCDQGQQKSDLALAEWVRFVPVTVRVPFRLQSAPRGYKGAYLAPSLTSSEGTFPGGVQFRSTEDTKEPRFFNVTVSPGRTEARQGLPGWESATIAGRPAVLSARDARLCLNLASHTACIEASTDEAEDLTSSLWAAGRRELLVDVAERLELADDLDDPKTWFPANRAIPH